LKSRRFDDGRNLRLVLAGMVTDRTVCSRIASRWTDPGLFAEPWANLVGRWSIEHLRKFDAPIGGNVRDAFEKWAAAIDPEESVLRSIERFLLAVSDEYEQGDLINSGYVLDVAQRLFDKAILRRVIEDAEDCLNRNKMDEAFGKLARVGSVQLGTGSMIEPAEDFDAWYAAFNVDREKPLIPYPGRLGKFFGWTFGRGKLVAFMAPDKTGKSMWLLDAAYRAVRNRCRVAYFDVGDMTEVDVLYRLGSRAAAMPLWSGIVQVPKSISRDGEVEYTKKKFSEGLGPSEAYRAFRKACKRKGGFRLSCHPNGTLSASDVGSRLSDWIREGWCPDVLVIDYADIMAPPPGVEDALGQIDDTWKHLRRISQECHCLVLTATQSSAAAYAEKQRTLTRRHFSGRKTKLAHVNGMIGLNVSTEDKDNGVTRVNWVVRRDADYNDRRFITVAGCPPLCCPTMKCCD